MQADDRDDLIWLAFRYIANEMTAAEVEAFESRLVEDQAAREAVAEAVDLSRAVAAVGPEVFPLRPKSIRRRAMPWLAAAAATLVAAGLIQQSFRHSSEMRTLAKFWARHLGQEPLNASEMLAGSEDAISIDEDDDLAVPSWMIEAVGGAEAEKWEDS